MNNSYKRIIYAIENDLRYAYKDIEVVPMFTLDNDKTPSYIYVNVGYHTLIALSKRYNCISVDLVPGTNTRLVNAILKHFTHGEYEVRKRGHKYVMCRHAESFIWTVEAFG